MRSLPHRCIIKRNQIVKDEYGTPKGDQWCDIGLYPCRLSRKSIRATQGAPDNQTNEVYMLYLPAASDIKAGDLAEVEGTGLYKLSQPYRPGSPYVEVQVEWEGSI